MKKNLILLVLAIVVVSCSAKQTTVILLPDDDGTVGAISVSTPYGEQNIETAYGYTTVQSPSSKPSPVQLMDAESVDQQFAPLIKAQPKKTVSFILYFSSGGTGLVAESQKLVPQIIKAVKDREPSNVTIIGHSDRQGSKDYNIKLSLERAGALKKVLLDAGLSMEHVALSSYGENDPLIPTADNVSEPKNRRVEILIR